MDNNDSFSLQSYVLSQIVDRNGNAITFNYQPATTMPVYGSYGLFTEIVDGFPLLTSISNSASTTLLTVNRATDGTGNVTSITDCYGRGVYYHEGSYATTNTPPMYSQSYQEVDHVSQIVPTGTGSPPDRWSLGYQSVGNGEGGETVPFLHMITVPSPAGPAPSTAMFSAGATGTSTASINYDSSTDLVSSLVDANGNTITFTSSDASGNALYPSSYTKVTYSNGSQVYSKIIGFDGNMSETSETDGTGNTVTSKVFADSNDPYRPSSVTDGNGNTTNYTWDKYGNLHKLTDPRGTVTNFTYGFPASTYGGVSVVVNSQSKSDAFGLGELLSMQEGSKTSTLYAYYEPSGLVNTVQTPVAGTVGGTSRSITSYTYDGLGNLLTSKRPGNNATVVNGTDQGITTTYNYTTDGSYSQSAAIGQPVRVTDNLGEATHLRYDSRGNTTVVSDAIGNAYGISHNIADQPLVATAPATGQQGPGQSSSVSAYLYPNGPLTGQTAVDENGTAIRQVNYTYGLEGETLAVRGSTEPVTYTYDALYRRSILADGNGNATHYYYKKQGYLDAVTYPGYAGPTPIYNSATDDYANISGKDSLHFPTYDLNGNVKTRVDGNNVTTTYIYNDPQSLLTNINYTYPGGYTGGTTGNVTLTYDSYGRCYNMADGTGSQGYSYDDINALLSVNFSYTGLTTKVISYAYNPDGSRTAMASPAGSSSYLYDAVGRMTKMVNPSTQTANWTYLANGWLWTQKLYNVQRSNTLALTTYTYNARGEVTEINHTHDNGTNPISDFRIPSSGGYDGVGNRLTWTSTFQNVPTYGRTVNYTYDTRNQLTQDTATGYSYTNNYAYDGGNIAGSGNPTTLRGYSRTYNADNQDSSNTYDGNGNPTTYNGTGNPATYNTQYLAYDPENRLTSYGSVLTCGYTGDGLRAWKANASGTRTYFLYDGTNPVCELSSNGSVTAASDFGANGVWGRHSQGVDWFYTWDPQGCIAQKIDVNGNAPASTFFNAYGQQTTTNSSPDPFGGFAGQWGGYSDWETGVGGTNSCLALMTHRFYDPNASRFLTRDPMGYAGGINLYAYTGNDPVNRADPLGLFTVGVGYGFAGWKGPFGAGADGGFAVDSNGGLGATGDVWGKHPAAPGWGGGAGGAPYISFSPGNLPPGDPCTGIIKSGGGFNGVVLGPVQITWPDAGGPPTISISLPVWNLGTGKTWGWGAIQGAYGTIGIHG